jgi:hypothetical protein
MRQGNTRPLARISIDVDRELCACMSQLLRHVLDWGIGLIELDGRITMPQVVDTIDAHLWCGLAECVCMA